MSNQQTDDMTKTAQAEKARRENEAAELKRKAEEEARRKLEEEARRVAEEARRMAEENKWTATPEPVEDTSDYHVTTSQHARQAEDENDREVEGGRGRGRNAKAARPAKKANMPNPKPIAKKRVLRFAAVKAASVKDLLYSKASRSPLRPLTATW